MWVFDRFKSWRKQDETGIQCPLCQQRNPEDAANCSRCSYELAKPSHQQDATIDDDAATDLFDQLIEDFEDDDEEEDIFFAVELVLKSIGCCIELSPMKM